MRAKFQMSTFAISLALSLLSCENEQFKRESPSKYIPNAIGIKSSSFIDQIGIPADILVGSSNGYNSIIDRTTANLLITDDNIQNLKEVIENAQDGDIIYIDDNLSREIMVTLSDPILIKSEIVIASGRGLDGSEGALLMAAETSDIDGIMFQVVAGGENSRIAGLRIYGCKGMIRQTGIFATRRIKVDNCVFKYWEKQAIYLSTNSDYSEINNNDISSPGGEGMGYGVCVRSSENQIYANVFMANRHHIAGSGYEYTSYYAFYNKIDVGEDRNHAFDMHGEYEHDTSCDLTKIHAGNKIFIYNNEFMNCSKGYKAVSIRGNPVLGCFIFNNKFCQGDMNEAIVQSFRIPCSDISVPKENVFSFNNHYSDDNLKGIKVSYSGSSHWYSLLDSTLLNEGYFGGNFDGNTNTNEAFYSEGGKWKIASIGSNQQINTLLYIANWNEINSSNLTVSRLVFGDFNGDNETDVFYANGYNWKVNWSGQGGWEELNRSSLTINNLAFGDFNNDNKTDVFYSNGNEWKVAWSGQGAWVIINTIPINMDELALADFDGNDTTDVFYADGNKWFVSWNGTSELIEINRSDFTIESLAFYDFNGDNKTDIFHANGQEWSVVWSGIGSWWKINTSNYTIEDLTFGDINGDGITDILKVN